MKRIHLFEFGDLDNCPKFLKNYLTDFLQYSAVRFRLYDDFVPIIKKALLQSKNNNIIDIGSGAGGGTVIIYNKLKTSIPNLDICLTDINPNIDAFERIQKRSKGSIGFSRSSIDATNIPSSIRGFRTMFKCFHHFKPETAKRILQDAVNKNEAIGVFEGQERTLLYKLYFFIINPILILLVTPFIGPFKWKRLVFTYVIPIMPLIICWDATVSCLRTYEPKDLREMISQLQNFDSYHWEINKVRQNHKVMLSLIGYPKN